MTAEEVIQIRTLKGCETLDQTAKRFGVSVRNIDLIQTGQTWRTPMINQARVFTEQEVLAIRAREGTSLLREMASEYGVSTSVIHRILVRRSYKWVEDSQRGKDAT